MLPAGAAGSKNILADVFVADFDFGRLADLRGNVDSGEAGLTLPLGIERADAHQPMHAGFPFQIAVGHRPTDHHRGVVDAGHAVVRAIEQLDCIALFLGPIQYIRNSISAQSLASVPPSRALIERMALLASCGPLSSDLSSKSSSAARPDRVPAAARGRKLSSSPANFDQGPDRRPL